MSVLSRFRGLFGGKLDRDLDAELRSHIEMRTEMNMRSGMTAEEARRDAARRFGNAAWMKEETRRADILPWFETVGQDVRYAMRMFRKSPVFTVVALITLTLGIGGNTAIFTLTHAVLLRSLPVQRPGELVRIQFSKPDQDFGLSGPMFDEIQKRQQVYTSVLGWSSTAVKVKEDADLRQRLGALASGNALTTLGVEPAIGRVITPDDDRPGGGADGWVAMLGYQFWISRYHGDERVLGQALTVNGTTVTIVGVLPRGFEGVNVGAQPDVVLPLEFEPVLHPEFPMRHAGGGLFLTVIGRLKPGASLDNAGEEINRIGPSILHDTDPKGILSKGFFGGSKWGVESGRTGRMYERAKYREPLLFLQILVGLILLICAANVSGLMLARSSARKHEFAVRAAVGATSARMVRQLCIETGMLAFAGAAAGLAVAKLASSALVSSLTGNNLDTLNLSPDRTVLGFTAAIACLATVVSAIPSALRTTRVQPVNDLKTAHVAGTRGWGESALVTAQVGLSVVLLVPAGLLAGSLRHLLTMDPGFRTAGVVLIPTDFSGLNPKTSRPAGAATAQASTSEGQAAETKSTLAYENAIERLRTVPGVESVSAEAIPLLSGWVSSTGIKATAPDGSVRNADDVSYNTVGPDYFRTAGTSVLEGRDVKTSDTMASVKVCWLNQSAAQYFFGADHASGQQILDGDSGKPRCTVAGVVQDTKYTSLRANRPRMIYQPFMQSDGETRLFLMLRSSDLGGAVASARRVLREVAPTTPVMDAITVREQLKQSIGREQTTAILAIFFGGLALLLAGVGLYGLLSYQVIQRTREIGVRIALGAGTGDVIGLVVNRVGKLMAIGIASGIAAAMFVSRLLSNLLFDVKPYDPASYAAAFVVLCGAAFVASYWPARRAAKVDPMIALRYE